MKPLPGKEDLLYWLAVGDWAKANGSDGCSGVPDFYIEACWEHDYHYRYARTMFDDGITRAQADARFRRVIQGRSRWGLFSPMSWWRWVGLRLVGERAWEEHRARQVEEANRG